jgi:tRNA(adenine34) deaminase
MKLTCGAIEQAKKGDLCPGASPIGCVIVRDERVLAEGYNEQDLRSDPTAHAEVVTIRCTCEVIGANDLRDATLYSTLQPWGMCSMASIRANIGKIVYGAQRHQVHSSYFESRHLDVMDFVSDAFRKDITVEGGVLAHECAALYIPPDVNIPENQQFNR